MSAYRLSGAAERDLMAIFTTGLDQFGLRQAEDYRTELKRQFTLIADFPKLARLRTEYQPPVRVMSFKAHVVVYEERDDGVFIVRVRHGREDWRSDPRGSETERG